LITTYWMAISTEDHRANHVITAHDELPERPDHFPAAVGRYFR